MLLLFVIKRSSMRNWNDVFAKENSTVSGFSLISVGYRRPSLEIYYPEFRSRLSQVMQAPTNSSPHPRLPWKSLLICLKLLKSCIFLWPPDAEFPRLLSILLCINQVQILHQILIFWVKRNAYVPVYVFTYVCLSSTHLVCPALARLQGHSQNANITPFVMPSRVT